MINILSIYCPCIIIYVYEDIFIRDLGLRLGVYSMCLLKLLKDEPGKKSAKVSPESQII